MLKLFFVLLISLQISASETDWVKLSKTNLDSLLELQKSDLRSIDLRSYSSEKMTLMTYGVPKSAMPLDPKGTRFRHYVGSGMDKILACNCLKAGFTPYIILNPGLGREIFDDLYGIFLTTVDAKPEEVGLSANASYDYIDFELDPDTGVLWLEPKIFLVPGRGDIPEWLKPKYLEYQKSGICTDITLCESFKRIDQHGGINPMFIPVKIKCIKQNSRLTCND
jgi:hypothetical protein